MVLSEIMLIKESINKQREALDRLAKSKGFSHPEVLQAREQLNREIIGLQEKYLK